MSSSRVFSFLNRHTRWGSFSDFRYWPFTIATWIPAVICFNSYVGDVMWINGSSMYPFLNNTFNEDLSKDACWNSRWRPTADLKRGMLISFRSPSHPETRVIKRIIALEGDTVYTRAPCPVPRFQVPVNHLWVEGDNIDTNKTLDSNAYGPIPINMVEGKVTRVLWPWRSARVIKWSEFRGRTKVIKGRRENAPGWD